MDTKKEGWIGNYLNKGRQWRQKVNGHDFPGPKVPRAYPYRVYDLGRNVGFANVGTDHDTGALAVASICGWWRAEGRSLYPVARRLLITANGGGSNGWRLRLWKWELQRLADSKQGWHWMSATSHRAQANGTRWNTGYFLHLVQLAW